jgi:hypothetical protein
MRSLGRVGAVDADAEFEGVDRAVAEAREAVDGRFAEERAVGQDGRGADREGGLEHVEEARVQERLAAGEVVFLHSQRHRLLQSPLDIR